MKNTNYFSTVPARDIELKVQSVNKAGVILCPYVSKRFVVKALNLKYGDAGWKVLRTADGKMASISIRDEKTGEWIDKGYDIGTASEFEAEKGLLTDSLKRAAALLGVANALATSPNIFIPRASANIYESNGKSKCYDRFRVLDIQYDDEECISYMRILNESTGYICFEWRDQYTQQQSETPQNASTSPQDAQDTQRCTETREEPQNAAQRHTESQEMSQQMTPPSVDYSEVTYPRQNKDAKAQLQEALETNEIDMNWFCEKMSLKSFDEIAEKKAENCLRHFQRIQYNWNHDKTFYVDETTLPFT